MSVSNRGTFGGAVAALALCAVACDDPTTRRTVGLDQPTSVATFLGITSKTPGELRPYVAIANGGRDDLTLVDVIDGEAVLAPVLVRPLVIPTAAHPIQLVSASLRDGQADLLAVVPAGAATLQVVRTWSEDNQVDQEVDLSAHAPGAEVLAAIAAPVPLDGTPAAAPGVARVVLALSGARLAVVDFTREPAGPGLVAGTPRIQPLPFQPVALSASPDARRLFAATADDLPAGSGIFGVVELDAAAAPGSWTSSMLPARAPTRLVAVARVQERDWADNDLAIPEEQPWVLRVYAALDPLGCGPGRPIDCGIVVLDPEPPVRGLVADPLGEMPYMPPIKVPGEVTALSAAIPPALQPEGYQPGRMAIYAAGDLQETAGVLVAAAANGRVYTVDLSRRTIFSERRIVVDDDPDSPNRVRVATVEPQFPQGTRTSEAQTFRMVVCDRAKPAQSCRLPITSAEARNAVDVGPGYAVIDDVRILYRGALPGLAGRRAQGGSEGGQVWVAIQVPTPSGPPVNFARLYDPALGVHVGDLVQLQTETFAPEACENGLPDDPDTDLDEAAANVYEGRVAGFALPDPARFPGGALLLEADGSACQAALRLGFSNLFATVRADGYVATGAGAGYLGRGTVEAPLGGIHPTLQLLDENQDPQPAEGPIVRYTLRYVHEDAPEQACPLDPWPVQPETVTCLGECRDRCERLSLARKSRRWYTLAESCGSGDTAAECRKRWGSPGPADSTGTINTFSDPFPNYLGPALDLRFAVRDPDSNKPIQGKVPEVLRPGHGLLLTVTSPYEPTYRVPGAGAAVMPTGVAPFDASPYERSASYRFYVAYTGDVVMGYSPSGTITSVATIR